MATLLKRLKERLLADTDALILDVFRISVGLLTFAYFIRLLLEAQDFSMGSGLIDHEVGFHVLWFTRLTLMGTWIDGPALYGLLGLGLFASLGLILGWRSRGCAFFIFVLVVCHSRRNFLVLSVDDCSIYLLMFWLILMPIGQTLSLPAYLKNPQSAKGWIRTRVSGATMRCFLANISLYYVTVGLSKFISPLWRDGYAVYAVLRMPISRSFGMWNESDFPYLWALNHLTIVFEALLAILPFLPARTRWKWLLLILAVGLHLSIIILIGVPYVNLTMLLAMILIFRHEIMDWVNRRFPNEEPLPPLSTVQESPRQIDGSTKLALAFLTVLCMVSTKGVPVLDNLYRPGVGLLYVAGIAQDYHLFDWIDRFNFLIENKVTLTTKDTTSSIDDTDLFPPNLRGKILQSYIHHMRWMPVSPAFDGELRRSILQRAAQRFAKRNPKLQGQVEVKVLVQKIDHHNLHVDKAQERPLMIFKVENGQAHIQEPY